MTFRIRKGRHYSNFNIWKLQPFSKDNIHQRIMFGEECWYPKTVVTHSGWNKLTGITGVGIHSKSARFVWRPDYKNPGYIKIAAYVYGKIPFRKGHGWYAKQLTTVRAGEWFEVKIQRTGRGWMMSAKDTPYNWVSTSINAKVPLILFKAYPYFGGRDTAYWDMEIEMQNV